MNSNNSSITENEIKALKLQISELAILITVKNTNMSTIEKRYNERIEILNKYIETLQNLIPDIKKGAHCNDEIQDTSLIKKLEDLKLGIAANEDVEDNDFVIIPRRKIKSTLLSGTAQSSISANTNSKIAVDENSSKTKLKQTTNKKYSCSYCGDRGHKRAHCPKILYQE